MSQFKLIGLAMGVDGVEDMSIVSAAVGGNNVLDAANAKLSIEGMTTRLGSLTIVDPALANRGLTGVSEVSRIVAPPPACSS